MSNTGFIAVHRKILEWEWYDHLPTKVLFIHCLLKANHETKKWRGLTIKRGQFITSLSNLSKETGLSIKQVRIAIENLEKSGELGKATNSANTCISVINYNNYQIKGTPKGKVGANEGQRRGKEGATTNNDNNDNNENKNINIKGEILNSNIWIEGVAKLNSITIDKTKEYLTQFLNEQELKGEINKSEKDIKAHFINTLKIKLKKEKQDEQKNNRWQSKYYGNM